MLGDGILSRNKLFFFTFDTISKNLNQGRKSDRGLFKTTSLKPKKILFEGVRKDLILKLRLKALTFNV